jgi:hypothetical protein
MHFPEIGIRGNPHTLFSDLSNEKIANCAGRAQLSED